MTDIHAHRGASAYAPENTMEAFRLAVQMQADFIELDVHLTKDKQIVVIHDDTIDRTSNGSGTVSDLTYEQLLQYDYNNNRADFKQVKLPLLEEVYQLVLPTPLQTNVEIKSHVGEIEKKLLELEERSEMKGRVLYSSFQHEALKNILKLDKKAKVGLLYGAAPEHPGLTAAKFGAYALHGEYRNFLKPEILEECRQYGIKTNFWTVDDREDIRRCLDAGIDGIITNRPNIARDLRNKSTSPSK